MYHVVYCNYMYIIWQRYAYWRVGNLSLLRVVVAVHLMACRSMDVAVHLFLHVCSENWTKPSSSKSDVRFKVTVLCFIWSALLIHVSWGCLWPRWVDGYQFLKVQHLRCVPKTWLVKLCCAASNVVHADLCPVSIKLWFSCLWRHFRGSCLDMSWWDMTDVDITSQWLVVDHTVVTNRTVWQLGFDPFHHTYYSLLNHCWTCLASLYTVTAWAVKHCSYLALDLSCHEMKCMLLR